MKFKELLKHDNTRNEAYVEFEKELTRFRDQYDTYDFDLNYSDNEHLIVLVESILEYDKRIHERLCECFDVKLVYLNHLTQQSSNETYSTWEYIYMTNDSLETELKWEDIRV
ncbi:MAG: hypothetical protein IJF83_03105 [Methanobrevibacter sp.]|nr:hypothetical protein [Methanobrevibacter sp.]